MKYAILGILFVTILLFGCIQEPVETPDLEEEQIIPVNGEEVEEKEEEVIDKVPDGTDEVTEGLASQRCVYVEEGVEYVYFVKDDKVKMFSEVEGMEISFIVHGNDNIMYDKGGLLLMGMMPGCTWVKYDFNRIEAALLREGIELEDDEVVIGQISGSIEEEGVICEDQYVSSSEFVVTDDVCDGTEQMIEFMLMIHSFDI